MPERGLPDGLVMREAVPGDRDALGDLLARVHAAPDGTPNEAVRVWQHDLFDHGHPTAGLEEILVVEDTRNGALASGFMTVPQTWSYGGVPIELRLLELAATDPDYRGRGLLKVQMRALMRRSVERGDLMQGITDILFFAEDTGLRTAITQRAGRGGYAAQLPPAPSIGLRPATVEDIPTLAAAERHAQRRSLLACVREEEHWRHELGGRSRDSMVRDELLIVEADGGPVGFLALGYGGVPSYPIPSWLPGLPCPEPWLSVARFELLPDACWLDIVPGVLRQLAATRDLEGHMLWLGAEHPAYEVLDDLLVRRPPHIGWFLRVPDLCALLHRIAPVLERRLRGSAAEGVSGELRLHFYRHGVRLRFERGRVAEVAPWPEHSRRGSDASLPEQMFVQLVLGHRTWAELAPAFPDCRLQTRTGRTLLGLLFPKQASSVWPLI